MTQPNFNKSTNGLLPAIVQDAQTQKILMLGYMNAEAWDKTQKSGLVTFFSRSKNRLLDQGGKKWESLNFCQRCFGLRPGYFFNKSAS